MTITTELEKLAALKEKGLLNDTEFEQQKQLLLEQSGEEIPGDKKGFWQWYLTSWKKFCTFSGRANRTEFFAFMVGNTLIGFILGFGTTFLEALQIVSVLFSLATILPGLAVYTRRFHDMGRSAWFAFIPHFCVLGVLLVSLTKAIGDYNATTPSSNPIFNTLLIVGGILILVLFITWSVFLFLKGTIGHNKYGAQPLQPRKYLSTIFAIAGVLFALLIGTSIVGGIAGYQAAMTAYETTQTQQLEQLQQMQQQLQNTSVPIE